MKRAFWGAALLLLVLPGSSQGQGTTKLEIVYSKESAEIEGLSRVVREALERAGRQVSIQERKDAHEFVAAKGAKDGSVVLLSDDNFLGAFYESKTKVPPTALVPVGIVARSPFAIFGKRGLAIGKITDLQERQLVYGQGPTASMKVFSKQLSDGGLSLSSKTFESDGKWGTALRQQNPDVVAAPLASASADPVLWSNYVPIAIAAGERHPGWSTATTLREGGVPVSFSTLYMLSVPAGVSDERIKVLGQQIQIAVQNYSNYTSRVVELGFLPLSASPSQARDLMIVRTELYAVNSSAVSPFDGAAMSEWRQDRLFVLFRLSVRSQVRIVVYRISSFEKAAEIAVGRLLPTVAPHEVDVTPRVKVRGRYHIVIYATSELGSVEFPKRLEIEITN